MNSDAVPPGTCTSSRHLKESSEARLDVPPLIAGRSKDEVQSESFKNDVEQQPGIDLVEHSQLRGVVSKKKKKSNPTSVIEKKDSSHAVVLRALPVYDPIWRGGFNIWNEKYKIIDGLAAHLSAKACQRVWEEAKLFSPFLHFEMLPQSDIWPKSFYTSEPSDDNIALFFFPSDAR
ncbi:hypothetical protein HAX54_019293 [Datura stramonium]|uniref:AIPP2-like SPOC-like domain-containing protein n=1 Tax=Datura stramonium TaxID=4076 RepID=A0ABS8Y601_DATST|nr:hypothetical protein [Datura stramonium]